MKAGEQRTPPDILALVREEASALVEPGGDARARLLSRLGPLLDPSVPAAPEGGPISVVKRFRWGALSGTIVGSLVGFGLGVGVGLGHAPEDSAKPHIVTTREIPTPGVVEVVHEVRTLDPPETSLPLHAESVTEGGPPRLPSDASLARERQLIEQGRMALTRADYSSALSAFEEHRKSHPNGQLSELREALAVQALVRVGRLSEADARRAAFRKAFPGSVYSPLLDPQKP